MQHRHSNLKQNSAKMMSSDASDRVIRLRPYQYIHV
jgi:hypothetical protein